MFGNVCKYFELTENHYIPGCIYVHYIPLLLIATISMPNLRKAAIPPPNRDRLKLQDKRAKSNPNKFNAERQLSRHSHKNNQVVVDKHGLPIPKVRNENTQYQKELEDLSKISANQARPNYMKIKSRKKSDERRLTGSKKEITVVTINANGRGALGLTPRYKIDLIKSYLVSSKPDAIFFQVNEDMVVV